MDFIKKNKTFTFLVSILVFSIGLLSILLVKKNIEPDETTQNQTTTQQSEIRSFQATMGNGLQLVFTWDIQRGKDAISHIEIYRKDKFFANVSDTSRFSMDFLTSGAHTGNNEFVLKVYSDNDRVMEKTTYLYIDEILDFKQLDSRQENKIELSVSYLHETNKEVKAPELKLSMDRIDNTESSGDIIPSFIKSEVLYEDENFKRIQSTYELDISQLPQGQFQVSLEWIFHEFDISKQTTLNFEILPK